MTFKSRNSWSQRFTFSTRTLFVLSVCWFTLTFRVFCLLLTDVMYDVFTGLSSDLMTPSIWVSLSAMAGWSGPNR